MSHDRLVVMANQIGKFFSAQGAAGKGDAAAVDGIADHLRKFWDPRMRASALTLLRQGGEGLDPLPRRAIEQLAEEHAVHHTEYDDLATTDTSPNVGDATEA